MKWEAEITTIANGKIITWPRLSRVSCFLFLFHIYTAPHLCSPQTQEWFCMAGFHILILWDEASENLRFAFEWAVNRNAKYSNYVGYSECLGWQVKLHRHFQMFTTEAVTEIMTKISTPRNRLSQQTIKWHEEVSLPTHEVTQYRQSVCNFFTQSCDCRRYAYDSASSSSSPRIKRNKIQISDSSRAYLMRSKVDIH